MTIYSTLLRSLLFRLDPEAAHHLAIAAGAYLGWAGPAMRMAARVDDDRLASEVAGLHFPTPIGLAAAGVEVSEVRTGRKPGTRVLTVRSSACGIPTLLVERTARS